MGVLARSCVSGRFKELTTWQGGLLRGPLDYVVETLLRFQVGKYEGPFASHLASVAIHYFEGSADVRRKVGLVDDQQIGTHDSRTAFSRDLVARGYVDDIDGGVGKIRAEGGGEIVTAALDKNDIHVSEGAFEIGDGFEVHGAILSNGGVRTTAGFDSTNALGGQSTHSNEELGVFPGVDVVRHGSDTEAAG